MDKIEKLLKSFINELKNKNEYRLVPADPNDINSNDYNYNIYNEISLQHELGKFLEENLSQNYKVFYERPIFKNKTEKANKKWVKKEVDIIIISKNEKEKYAIELKFSRGENARTPENMFDFIKDIKFMEQVKKYANYTYTYNLIIVNSQKYFNYKLNKKENNDKYNIYEMFRIKANNDKKIKYKIPKHPKMHDKYLNPTGNTKTSFDELDKEYKGTWKLIYDNDKEMEIYQYRYILISH